MSTKPNPPSQVAEDHLLEFYEERRRCFLNTRTRLKHIWSAFELADTVWVRELDDLSVLSDRKQIISVGLFHDALVKIRLSTELAFSRCPTEACDLMRGAVESVAYGSFLAAQPQMALVWAAKNHGEDGRREFMQHFVWGATKEEKKEKEREGGSAIFAKGHGLGKLRPFWKSYSELGAHTAFGGSGYTALEPGRQGGSALRVSVSGHAPGRSSEHPV